MGNSNTIAPYKLDRFQKSMDNGHNLSLKDLNIRMYIECIQLQCCRPNQQSLLLNYFLNWMKTTQYIYIYLTAVGVFRRLTCHMLQRDAVLFSRRGSQEMWQGNEG